MDFSEKEEKIGSINVGADLTKQTNRFQGLPRQKQGMHCRIGKAAKGTAGSPQPDECMGGDLVLATVGEETGSGDRGE